MLLTNTFWWHLCKNAHKIFLLYMYYLSLPINRENKAQANNLMFKPEHSLFAALSSFVHLKDPLAVTSVLTNLSLSLVMQS